MKTLFRDKFISQWRKYFKNAELPITFEYTDDYPYAEPMSAADGFRCVITQITAARNGRTVHFIDKSVKCRGGSRYLGYTDSVFAGFNEFISHNESGHGERYKKNPKIVGDFIKNIDVLPIKGSLVVKRWDMLEEYDTPQGVVFFAKPDVLAALFTLANYEVSGEDGVITPFGAGCSSIFFYPYREYLMGGSRAIIGLFDLSARKFIKSDLISFAVPIDKFVRMVEDMDESFLITDSWNTIHKRLE